MFDLVRFLKGLTVSSETDPTKQLSIQISPSATTGTSTTVVAAQTSNQTITLPDVTGTVSTSNSTETLTNKTIDGDNNTLQDIGISSLKTNLSDASNFLVRDASGIVVSNSKAVPTGVVVGNSDTQTLTNKSIDASANTVTNIVNANVSASAAIAVSKLAAQTESRAVATDASGFLTPSATTSAELGFVSGVTSAIQTQLNSKATSTGSFTDNHVIRADGTANVQTSNVVVDDSGNVTGATSVTLTGGGLSAQANTIQANSTSALLLTTNSTSQQVYTDRQLLLIGSGTGVVGSMQMRGDTAIGANVITVNAPATVASNRTITLPDATTTLVGTDATQTLSNKTFSDAVTLTQIATPSNPAATKDKLYTKSDDGAYLLNSSGTENQLAFVKKTLVTKTATYTATASDEVILCDATSSSLTINLPTAVGIQGKIYTIKRIDHDIAGHTVVIDPSASQTVDEFTTWTLYTVEDSLTIVSDNANWRIISQYNTPFIITSNTGFSQTQPASSNTWQNIVGNSVDLSPGTWELSGSIFYTNSGSSPGYSNHYGYWCAATGNNTSTNPAALSTISGLTVLGGYTGAYIADSSTSNDTMVVLPTIIISLTVDSNIYVGTRATMTTPANARWIPNINAKRISNRG